MRVRWTWVLVVGCLTALTLACFGRAIVRGEQFGYRDAAHFYYPLYQRVQQGWEAGQWPPLWEPEENGGMPLLGNPTAAVLYPGKLIFAAVSYPLGARLYVIGHALLAFGAMFALLRSWGTSPVGSGLGALAYAFGGPILFQYCNIIYLVGAAWAPLGIRAADRWLRLGRRGALLELAVVLALETLGGDPEVAYLTGLCAGGYAAALAWVRAREADGARGPRAWVVVPALLVLAAAWVVGTLAVGRLAARLRSPQGPNQPSPTLPWMPWVGPAVAAAWGTAGVWLLVRWRERRRAGGRPVFVPMLAGLAGAAVLAAALAAAQLLPVLEFTGQSARAAGEGPHDIFPFSLEPVRAVELLWPNLFGTPFHGNRSWLSALSPPNRHTKVWVPTLYLGGLSVALALGAATLRFRGPAPWRGWMTAVAALSLLASFGEFTGPLWWARQDPRMARVLGPPDTDDVASIRFDRHLRDGDGSFYWALATALPGFRQFRFPSKLLTFTALALAALAGQGWDLVASGDRRARRATAAWASLFLVLSLATLAAAWGERARLAAWLLSRKMTSPFGPLDAPGAVNEMLRGFAQGAGVFAAALALAVWGRRRAGLAAAVALGVSTADLATANARYVLTVPQRFLDDDNTPEVVAAIRAAERDQPSPGPYRVHRLPIWDPAGWLETPSDDRVADFVRWERGTIQPKYGITLGIHYTLTIGVAELFDYEWFFGSYYRKARPDVARSLGVAEGANVLAYPRRSFDLWTTRYFVLPYYPGRWDHEHRGFASFLENSERIYPPLDAFEGPGGREKEIAWARDRDVQVRRNKAPYPRAWVVHQARFLRPIRGLSRADRKLPMEEITFSNDWLWRDPTRAEYDPRRFVWAESRDTDALAPCLPGGPPGSGEVVTVTRYEPERVELSATLDRPGVVVLADVYYPGWTLTIDGRPAPVYRANRMMRGAAVGAGRHTLVYTFRPASFRVGGLVSLAGLAALGLLGLAFVRRPTSPALAGTETEDTP